jgi:diaminopimelate decarboxylase
MHHFAYRRGVSHENVLHAEEVDLAGLAAAVGTPFYCYSKATLERHYRVFADAFAEMPGTLVCYSVKANSSLGVLATLALAGAGMDVVSHSPASARPRPRWLSPSMPGSSPSTWNPNPS